MVASFHNEPALAGLSKLPALAFIPITCKCFSLFFALSIKAK